jgi:hypothetical protein
VRWTYKHTNSVVIDDRDPLDAADEYISGPDAVGRWIEETAARAQAATVAESPVTGFD